MRTVVQVVGLLVLTVIGYIKGAPLLAQSPIDLTLVGAVIVTISVLVAGPSLLRMKGLPPLLLLYAALIIGAIPAGAATEYSLTKNFQIALLVPLCLSGGRIILGTPRARQLWLYSTVTLGVIVAVLAVAFPDDIAAESGQLSIEGGNTIGAARGVGAAVTVLAIWALHGKHRRLACIVVAAGLVGILLLIGSRGPILAAVIAISGAVLLSRQPGRPARVMLAGFAIVLAAWAAIRASDQLSSRLYTLQGDSADVRLNLWSESLRIAADYPLGIGWGQLEAHLRSVPSSGAARYSHNLLLEILVEAGWVAVVIVAAVIAYAFLVQHRATVTTTETAMLALLVFALASAMVSGDVHSNREVWVAVGAALVWAGRVNEAAPPTVASTDPGATPFPGNCRSAL